MIRQPAHVEARRPPLRGICLVVKENRFVHTPVRFAERSGGPRGCATMFLAEHLELDLENRGKRLIGWISAVLNAVHG